MTALIFVLALFWACSDRERANPFDPLNPETDGTPAGTSISSQRDTVFIRWSPMEIDDIVNYTIYRSINSAPFETLVALDPENAGYEDTDIFYDQTYRYALQVFTLHDASALSDTLRIIPGPVNFWVSDFNGFDVRRITYDGAHILRWESFSAPIAIEYSPAYGRCYIADYWEKQISIVNKNLSVLATIPLQDWPVDMEIDNESQKLYILLKDEDYLAEYSLNGQLLNLNRMPFDITNYTTFAYDPISSSFWFYDPSLGTVHVAPAAIPNSLTSTSVSIVNPGKIKADPILSGCWVPSQSGIYFLRLYGAPLSLKTDYHILDLSINPLNGDCYYVGYQRDTNQWETGRLIASRNYTDEVILDNAYPGLYKIQAIPGYSPQGFIAFQSDTWKLLRFDTRGIRIGELEYFGTRLDIVVE